MKKEVESGQGNYLDQTFSPYSVTNLSGKKLEIFNHVIDSLAKKNPDMKFADLVDEGFSIGAFEVKQGKLEIAPNPPHNL